MKEIDPKRSAVTMVDVAEAAGVSAITVSRSIRRPELVSEEARLRVAAAIERLGYVPDAAASALASKRTDVVGLLVPSLTNSVFSEVLRGIYDAVEGTPYSVQIGNFRYSPSGEERLIRTFLRQKPAGMIVAGLDQTDSSRAMLEQAECRVVQIMDQGPKPVDLAIGFSHRDGAVAAVEHLLEQGYERIGFMGARMDPRSQRRLAGFTEALKARGLFEARRVVTTPAASTVGLGGQLLGDLLARAPEVDAVFCNNDDLAAGALLEAARRGIEVPRQLGICGFNDLEMSRFLNPALSSVATPRYRIGRGALELLMRVIDAPEEKPEAVDLGTEVKARASTARRG